VKPVYHKVLLTLALLLILAYAGTVLHAQGCSQCRLVPQSDQQGGGTAAGGINKGILYMMALPYIILFILFRKPIFAYLKRYRERLKAKA
jgi:UPF0716 family protein affecting phage T7 exclusion